MVAVGAVAVEHFGTRVDVLLHILVQAVLFLWHVLVHDTDLVTAVEPRGWIFGVGVASLLYAALADSCG